jgi:pilus assembly protein CpaE
LTGQENDMPNARKLNVLSITRSPELRLAIGGSIGERSGYALNALDGDLQAINGQVFKAAETADIVIVDLDASNESEVAHLGRLVEQKQGKAAVLATARNCSGHGVRNLIRQGIDDFIPQPAGAADILEAVEAARLRLRRLRQTDGLGKVITVGRAHGGMGATTLATHLALGLREKQRRDPQRSVLLVDLDLQFGDVALMLDLPPKGEMARIIREPDRLDQDLLLAAAVEHKSGLAVLPAPIEPVPLDAMSLETVARLLELAREQFDYVVVDLPLALPRWLEAVLAQSHKMFVVTQLNVPAIRQTRRLLDIIKDEALLDGPASVVLNRYAWRLSERSRLKQAAKALGQPIEHYLPDDRDLALDSVNRGVSLFEAGGRARLCRTLRDLAGNLAAAAAAGSAVSATAR